MKRLCAEPGRLRTRRRLRRNDVRYTTRSELIAVTTAALDLRYGIEESPLCEECVEESGTSECHEVCRV